MSVKKDLISGVFFTAIAKYSGIIISLIISGVLARLLSPKEFGVVGVATVIINFFNILGDIGIGPAIIQRDNLTKDDIKSIHSFTSIVGITLAALFFCCSWLIAQFYNDASLTSVCQILSLSIFFNCFGIVPINLQYKSKNFRKIAIITLSIQILVGIVSIIFAILGGGVYALVSSSVLSSAATSIIYNIFSRTSLTFQIHKQSLLKIASFSIYQFLFNIINYFSRNLDKVLIGKFIGFSQLGYYEKSYRLMLMPLQNISFVITPVLLPVFSDIKNNITDLTKKYLKLLNILAYVAFPLGAMLYFCAKELILIIFGNQWVPSIIPFQILTFTVGMQILNSTAGTIYQAVDATKQLLNSGCIGALFMICSFALSIGYYGTLIAVCYGYLFAQILNTIQTFYLLFNVLGCKKFHWMKILIKPLYITIFLYCIFYISIIFLKIENLFFCLLVKLIICLIFYTILIQLFGSVKISDIMRDKINLKKLIYED